jgi:hypothetical protein
MQSRADAEHVRTVPPNARVLEIRTSVVSSPPVPTMIVAGSAAATAPRHASATTPIVTSGRIDGRAAGSRRFVDVFK